MKVLLSARGSRGDVHPILEIGKKLREAGHEVRSCVPSMFWDLAEQHGLAPVLYDEDSGQVMRDLGAGWDAARRALRWFSKNIQEQFDVLVPASDGVCALVTTVNEVAAPSVAAYRRIPHFRVAYAPILAGDQPPPLVPWQRLPGIANWALWKLLNGTAGLLLGKPLNRHRAALGLGPIGNFGDYVASDSHTILAINATLAPPSWNWRQPHSYAGYCWDAADGPLDVGLRRFLAAGPPPVYVGFGSVDVPDPERFSEVIRAAARRADCRIILGSGWTGLGSEDLPDRVFVVGDTPHATLFPRLSGIAHHGGCGTTHTAMRAGIPQFVMPQLADQFYWGERIHALGMGPRPHPPHRLTVTRLARALSALSRDPGFAHRARALARAVRHDDGATTAARTVLSAV